MSSTNLNQWLGDAPLKEFRAQLLPTQRLVTVGETGEPMAQPGFSVKPSVVLKTGGVQTEVQQCLVISDQHWVMKAIGNQPLFL